VAGGNLCHCDREPAWRVAISDRHVAALLAMTGKMVMATACLRGRAAISDRHVAALLAMT